jgi:hypothetical protein
MLDLAVACRHCRPVWGLKLLLQWSLAFCKAMMTDMPLLPSQPHTA